MGTSYMKLFFLTVLNGGRVCVRGLFFKKYTYDLSGSSGRSLTLPPPTVGRFLSKGESDSVLALRGHRLRLSQQQTNGWGSRGSSMASWKCGSEPQWLSSVSWR